MPSKNPKTPRAKSTGDEIVTTKAQKAPRSKTEPRKAKDTDETSRVGVSPSANEPGPAAGSEGATTDERGAKGPRGSKGAVVLPEGERHSAGEDRVEVHALAARQPSRDSHFPTTVHEVKVDGEPVEVYTTPGRLDPSGLKPSKRDTVVKDQLRAEGLAKHADAPVRENVGGDWHDTDVRVGHDEGPEPSRSKRKDGE